MKKTILISTILLILIAGGFIFYNQSNDTVSQSESGNAMITSPTRPAEITGYIVSALGNEVTVAKEIDKVTLSEAEQEAKKAEMQKLSPEERAAAREAETAALKTEDVTLIIPVGIALVKGSGDATGNVVSADIADLAKGIYVSIWIDATGNIEYIKIKGS
jgi:hypothetical protein